MENDIIEGEVLDSAIDNPTAGALATITKAEIDQQVATAHQWPRSLAIFKRRALEMVSFDEETAESCIFRRPVGKERDPETGKMVQKYAEGMSVRMAEIVLSCFGNMRAGSMVLDMSNPRFVRTRGFAHDLESNVAVAAEVIEATTDKNGKPYSERMRVVTAKAALSKARRDATFQVIPRALCRPIELEARKVAIGDATTLAKRRDRILAWIKLLGIDEARVWAAIEVKGIEEVGIEQLTLLTGLKTAIKDKETTVDEAFPPLSDSTDGEKSAAANAAAQAAAKAAEKAKAKAPAKVEDKAEPKVDQTTGEVLQQPANGQAPAQADAFAGKNEEKF